MLELFLLLIVILCAVQLFRIVKRQKDEEESGLSISDTTGSDGSKSGKIEESESGVSRQNTIYAFCAKHPTRLCPFCDGENEEHALTCRICGEDLS